MARVLYVSYDGLMEPLGQSQIWQYVNRLSQLHQMTILSFEKPADMDSDYRKIVQQRCSAAGVTWKPLRYHKTPTTLATAYDVLMGTLVSLYVCWRSSIQIVHARGYVPSIIAMALNVRRQTNGTDVGFI